MSGPVFELNKTFGATGQSDTIKIRGKFNVLIASASGGGVGVVRIDRRLNGVTQTQWLPVSKNSNGDDASYSVSGGSDVGFNGMMEEVEDDAEYRFNCTAWTSGGIECRISL